MHKLDDELIKFIKAIASALLKDATPDDLAMMTQQNGPGNSDANSEFSRLQRLPGFARMQRQLFFNMMTARPDVSDQNVRIDQIIKGRKGGDGASAAGFNRKGVLNQASLASGDTREEDSMAMEERDGPSLDRNTIKSISRLIVDRDGGKIKAAENNEPRKKK